LRVVVKGDELASLRDITPRVHFVNNAFAAKNPEAIRGFFRAHQKALDYMFENKADTAKIWIRRADLKFPESAVLKTWDFYTRQGMALKPIRGLKETIEDGIRNKFLTQPLTDAENKALVDLSFLP
jgi:ABC-type nitrate/sulfonate/bicarbonate transport system substrate-binding protein